MNRKHKIALIKKRRERRQQALAYEHFLDNINRIQPKVILRPKGGLEFDKSAPPGRETPNYPSMQMGPHSGTMKSELFYSGSKIKGIGTLHKSNGVPVFSDEEAVDIARMRR
jgi:hypothetical protein